MKLNRMNWERCPLIWMIIVGTVATACCQKIKWSANYEMSSIFNKNEIIQVTRDGFYVLEQYKDANYYYQRKVSFYDWNFNKKEGANTIDFSYHGTKGSPPQGISIKEKPYVWGAVNDENKPMQYLWLNGIDTGTLDLNKATYFIDSVGYEELINPKEPFRSCRSLDQSKILFYGEQPHRKRATTNLGALLVDVEIKQVWKKEISLPQKAGIFTTDDVVDAVVSDAGDAYLLCKLYKGKDKKEEKKIGTRFVYSVVYMGKQGSPNAIDTLKVLSPKDSAIVVSAKLSVDPSTGKVICIGTYKLPRKKAGLFSLNLNSNFSEQPVVIDYPSEILEMEAKIPRKIKKRKHLSLKNYKIKSVFEQSKAGRILVAEQHYVNAYWDKSEGRQELHELNNLLIAKVIGDQVEWATVLPKRQKAGGEGYTNVPEKLYSFYACERGGYLHLLYNELKENLDVIDEFQLKKGYYNKPKSCHLVHCKINLKTGTLESKKSILGLKEDGVAIYPKATKLLEDGNLLLLGEKPAYNLKEPAYIRFGHWTWE